MTRTILANFVYSTLFSLIFGTLTCTSAYAAAPIINKTALAGHTIQIIGLSAVDASCAPAEPGEIRVLQQPSHGTLTLSNIDAFPNYPITSPKHVCNTTKTPSIALNYTAAADFTGTDIMSIEIFTPSGGDTNEVKVLVTVK